MSVDPNDMAEPEASEPIGRPQAFYWGGPPDGSPVYGRDAGAPVPSEAPPDYWPLVARLTGNGSAAAQSWIQQPPQYPPQQFHDAGGQIAPPPAAWHRHLGPARTPDEIRDEMHADYYSRVPQTYVEPAAGFVPDAPPAEQEAPAPVSNIDLMVPGQPPPSPNWDVQPQRDLEPGSGALGLAFTALAMALVIPPIAIGLGFFCLSVARREHAAHPSSRTSTTIAVASIALVAGIITFMALIYIIARIF